MDFNAAVISKSSLMGTNAVPVPKTARNVTQRLSVPKPHMDSIFSKGYLQLVRKPLRTENALTAQERHVLPAQKGSASHKGSVTLSKWERGDSELIAMERRLGVQKGAQHAQTLNALNAKMASPFLREVAINVRRNVRNAATLRKLKQHFAKSALRNSSFRMGNVINAKISIVRAAKTKTYVRSVKKALWH